MHTIYDKKKYDKICTFIGSYTKVSQAYDNDPTTLKIDSFDIVAKKII